LLPHPPDPLLHNEEINDPGQNGIHGQEQPPSSPKDDIVHDIVHVVGYEVVTLRDDDEIETVAKSTLMSTLESAEYEATGSHNAYDNHLGLAVLSDIHDQRQRLASLEDWKAESKTKIASLEDRLNDQRRDIDTLKKASEGYRKIRNRFLDVYRREVLHNLEPKVRQNIADGNEAAHHGDAVADAALYASGERHDRGIIVDIYGLDPDVIASLDKAGDFKIIKVLNAGATWRANQIATPVPSNVEAAFATFVRELGLSQSSYKKSLTDGVSRLSKAYYVFWAAHREHKGD